MTRAAGYVRVSTAHQAAEGLSLDEQVRRVNAYIDGNGWENAGTYVEKGVSGAVPFEKRPEFGRLLTDLDGIDRIVCPKLDRLGRSTRDLLGLFERVEAAGVAIVSLAESIDTSTSIGRLTRSVLAAISEFERDRLSERVAEVTDARARQGGWHGGPAPYGFGHHDDGGLIIEPTEAAIVTRIFSEFVNGASQRQIARDLNRDKIKPRNGAEWAQGTVGKILRSPVSVGRVRLKGEIYDGSHEAIIDAATWQKSEALRTATSRAGRRGRRPTANHLLADGMLRCGRCGSAMSSVSKPARGNGIPYEAYRCSGRVAHGLDYCDQMPIRREPIDSAVFRFFTTVALDLDATKAAVTETHDQKMSELAALKAQAEADAQKAEARIIRVRRDYQDGRLDADDWREQRTDLTAELDAARAQADRLTAQESTLTADLEQIDTEGAVLEELTALRATVVGDAQEGSRHGIDAFRAALRRLFSGFELLVGYSLGCTEPAPGSVVWPHDDLALDGMALLPHLRTDLVTDWWDAKAAFPALRRAALQLSGPETNRLPT